MLPRASRAAHGGQHLRALCVVALAGSAGCYHRNPGPVPYDAAAAPARVEHVAPNAPEASIEVMVRAGSAHDPMGREGLAWLTADLLRHGGTRAMDPAAFDGALADLGAEIDVTVGPEVVRFRARGPAANGAAIEALLGAMLSAPRFDDAALSTAILRATDAIAARGNAEPPALASDAIRAWVFRGHPYGHLMEGRSGDLATIRAPEVRQFYADRYVRIATVGCVAAPSPAGDALGAALEALPPRLYRDVTPRIVEPVEGRRTLWVEHEGTEASIHLAQPLELHPGEGAGALVAVLALEEQLTDAVETKRALGSVQVALDPFEDEPVFATVQPMLQVAIDRVASANVATALQTVFDALATPPDQIADADAIRARLANARAVAVELDPCGFALANDLVGPSASHGLADPVDPDVVAATLRRVWRADGWKVLVVGEGGHEIAAAIDEGNPAPLVYATDDLFR
jgi:hypothetical protein